MCSGERIRVALLSPYWGGNLGDGAILQATIDNLRALHSNIDFEGIVMHPEGMQRHHGIGATRLVSYSRYYYSNGAPVKPVAGDLHPGVDSSDLALISRFKLWCAGKFPRSYSFVRYIHQYISIVGHESFHFVEAVRIMRRTSVLVVAGGGQLDEEWGGAWGHPYALFKWAWAARLAGRPLVFLSVGVCKLESPLGRWFCARALNSACMVSIRDPWSKSFVESRLHYHGASLAPDLAFSLPLSLPDSHLPAVDNLTIGISPIAYGQSNVWPTKDQAASENYLRVLVEFIKNQLGAGHNIVLFYTDGPDKKMVKHIADQVKSMAPGSAHSQLRTVGTGSLTELFAILVTLDLVIASRLHGLILSHMHRIPSLAISYDRKVTTYMEQVNESDLCLDLSDIRLDVLTEVFMSLTSRRHALHDELARLVAQWRSQLVPQYRQVLELTGGTSGNKRLFTRCRLNK